MKIYFSKLIYACGLIWQNQEIDHLVYPMLRFDYNLQQILFKLKLLQYFFWPVTIQSLPKWLIKLKKILQKLDFIVWTSVCSKYLESFFYNTTFLAFLIWYLTFASQKPCDFYQKSIFHCHITCILSKIGLTRYWFFFQGWL